MDDTRGPIDRMPVIVLGAALLWLAGAAPAGAQSNGDFTPVTDAMLQNPAPGDWLTWRRTLDGWGYSPLDQVDRDNVGTLRMVWTRALTRGSNQGTPLVYDGTMYMPNPGDVIRRSTRSRATCSGNTGATTPTIWMSSSAPSSAASTATSRSTTT